MAWRRHSTLPGTGTSKLRLIDLRNKMCNDLRCETELTWREIADTVNEEFPGALLDMTSAEIAARNYRRKHGLPAPPPRRRGRRRPAGQ